VINVFEKEIQCGDSLREATFDLAPFLVRNDSRQQVIGEDALGTLVVSVHRERDPLVQK